MERSRTMQGGRQIMLNNTPKPDVKITSRPTFIASRKLSYWVNYASSMHRNVIFCVNLLDFQRYSRELTSHNSTTTTSASEPTQVHKLTVPRRYCLDFHAHVCAELDVKFRKCRAQNAVSDENLARFATDSRTLTGKTYIRSQTAAAANPLILPWICCSWHHQCGVTATFRPYSVISFKEHSIFGPPKMSYLVEL